MNDNVLNEIEVKCVNGKKIYSNNAVFLVIQSVSVLKTVLQAKVNFAYGWWNKFNKQNYLLDINIQYILINQLLCIHIKLVIIN